MTNITYKVTENAFELHVKGHAEYVKKGERGHDVVCAAISILVQTLAIRLEAVTAKYTTHIEPGDVEITGEGIRAVDTFWTVFTGLKALSDSYPENVKMGAL